MSRPISYLYLLASVIFNVASYLIYKSIADKQQFQNLKRNIVNITDEYMNQMISQTKNYCVVILKAGPGIKEPGADKIIWEHARRNFALRADGKLSIVCPVADGSGITGIGIFSESFEEVRTIMDEDPGVKVGVFTYEIHPCRSFPGDSLPG